MSCLPVVAAGPKSGREDSRSPGANELGRFGAVRGSDVREVKAERFAAA
ncbi:MAG TPA: hypothetical protein VGR72_09840 [Candidatus Acidoferrales bacterium]|nr:hypothetical protein [Candidatus Acidoferrales bacterium]